MNKERDDNPHYKCPDCNQAIYTRHCLPCILGTQGPVTRCEAQLFCEIAHRLRKEVVKACDFEQLAQVVRLANSFLLASAAKEKAIATLIAATREPEEHEHECFPCSFPKC
ncbi:MAG: hypothetical protein ACOY3H_03525 [Bacillota bacterium]|uniref:hypothetical protein n=1 Tax=unclassified Carboxydocella TaxID=2685367 RepID=UPI0009AE3BDD|nr:MULTISPECIES: hypothetical protein [unclassified Carboxydocella]AVX30102.1 hypothetical protein CTH_0499 [Carboxydocella thermautotrophica]GAW29557.1 hypothetical protein ULO1_21270 [Carboxydocella sp. ULO1]GAW32857.1 hypothetical protein JDF658_26220 [Carboxydocella sp. JDF658]